MYREHPLAKKSAEVRHFKTVDIVERLGMLSPEYIHIKRFAVEHPVSIFNASAVLENDTVVLYARIIVGYYMYVSAIVKIDIPLNDILTKTVPHTHYPAEIVIKPSVRQDIWGCEDPRAFMMNGSKHVIYTGRTIWYFNPVERRERTVPIMSYEDSEGRMKKVCAFIHPPELRGNVISDKDSFALRINNDVYLFHRPHVKLPDGREEFYAVVSSVDDKLKEYRCRVSEDFMLDEITVSNPTILLRKASFETKIGWGTPPIEVERGKYLMLIHGIDKYIEAYRAYAALIEFRKDEGFVPVAVTPTYIMEPREPYEVYGDRPYVVFPCGLIKLNHNEALTVYGAADYFVGFGLVDINELLGELDKGRLE